jgi:hypothetical protein
MAQRHPRRGAGGAGSGGVVETRPGSRRRGGEEEADKRRPRVSEGREREGADDGRRESKKKTYFCKYANACAGWPAGPSGLAVWARESWAGRQAKAGEVAGRLGRRPSGPQGRPGRK